jgi:hypothetical protein
MAPSYGRIARGIFVAWFGVASFLFCLFMAANAMSKRADNGIMLPATPETAALFASGQWTLERLFVGPELGEFPLASKMGDQVVSMEIDADGSLPMRMSLKVVNSIRFLASPDVSTQFHPFQALAVAPGPSTKMMGPSAMMEAETAITRAFTAVTKWLVTEDTLLLVGPTAELSFRRTQTVTDGSTTSQNAKNDLLAKIHDIKTLKAELSSQGMSSAEVERQVAPLMDELKALKQKAGPARFDNVVPIKMPTMVPRVFLMGNIQASSGFLRKALI